MNATIASNKNNPKNPKKKTTQGRKKIEITKINEKNNLQVTFSKRRAGLFKKANELCLLCGAEVAIITFSPGKKAYIFGHPSVDALLDRFLSGEDDASSEEVLRAQADAAYVNQANRAYDEAVKKLEEEEKRAKAIEEEKKVKRNENDNNAGGLFWWNEKIDEMEMEELEEYVKSMQEMRKKVIKKIDQLMMMDSWFSNFVNKNNYSNNVDQVNDLMMEKCFADQKNVGDGDGDGPFDHIRFGFAGNY